MNRRGVFSSMVLSLAALAGLAAAPAQARDRVYWSVDVAAPGVATTVSNYRSYPPAPVVVYPSAPVVHYPPPVVYAPPPPVVYAPRPVYVHPAPVVIYRDGYRDGHRHGHGKHWHHNGYRGGHGHGHHGRGNGRWWGWGAPSCKP